MNFLVVVSVPFTTKSRLLFQKVSQGKMLTRAQAASPHLKGWGPSRLPPTPLRKSGTLGLTAISTRRRHFQTAAALLKTEFWGPKQRGPQALDFCRRASPPSDWVPQTLRSTISVFQKSCEAKGAVSLTIHFTISPQNVPEPWSEKTVQQVKVLAAQPDNLNLVPAGENWLPKVVL